METTHYVLEHFYRSTHTPVHAYTPDGQSEVFFLGYTPGADPLKTDGTLLSWLINHFPQQEKPWLHYELDVVCYAVMRDSKGYLVILGPVCLYEHTDETIQEFIRHHKLPWNFQMPIQDIVTFSSSVSLLYYLMTQNQISITELSKMDFSVMPTPLPQNRALQTYVMNRREEDAHRFDYLTELEKMKPVVDGDVEAIRQEITPDMMRLPEEMTGKMANQPLKQWEYSAVSSITLATRAAVQGGVPPTTAYALSDTMLQHLSKCTDFSSIMQLQGEVRLTFAACVRDFRNQSSPFTSIEEAKVYMRTNLNKQVTLDQIAAHVNMSAAHLCRKFKEAEGITPMEYLQDRRINAAKDLLLYSNNSISYIAQYLCFHSQSHFGAVFKKATGKTPSSTGIVKSALDLNASCLSLVRADHQYALVPCPDKERIIVRKTIAAAPVS